MSGIVYRAFMTTIAFACLLAMPASAITVVSDHAWQSAPTIPGNNCIDNNTTVFPTIAELLWLILLKEHGSIMVAPSTLF